MNLSFQWEFQDSDPHTNVGVEPQLFLLDFEKQMLIGLTLKITKLNWILVLFLGE